MKGLASIFLLIVLLATPHSARAQGREPQFELRLSRDWGYGGLDNRIQGSFSFRAEGPQELDRVEFYIDEQLVARVDAPPFEVQFDTGSYTPGEHRLYALGYTRGGARLESNALVRVFLTLQEARSSVVNLLLPLFALIAVVGALSAVVSRFFFRRGEPHTAGEYGLAGGAVCKRCGLPFSRRLWSPNLLTGKLERCPHCGKWAVVRRASPTELGAAEARLNPGDASHTAAPAENAEERLRRQIEESRYA